MSASKRCRAGRSIVPPEESAIVIMLRNRHPAFTDLALNVGRTRFPLCIQRIERLLQTFLSGFARIDRAPALGLIYLCGSAVLIRAARGSFCSIPKNEGQTSACR